VPEKSHLSIGEVLSLLREEFPDVTISKIRFLESQGLVDPERTPSGYRKFYDHDVERLRWILRQQRENFLPLKVIRGRLTENPEPAPARPEPVLSQVSRPAAKVTTPSLFAQLHRQTEPEPEPEPEAEPVRPPARSLTTSRRTDDADAFTAEELAAAVGVQPGLIEELKQFGLVSPHAVVAGVAYYDDTCLAIARAAAELARHGVEARHLRIWRNAADREADLFQQVVLPLLRQRNPQARRQAADTLSELTRVGADLRAALVERATREIR
jgi:DNA-binding transcriptional MerR regulator